MGTIQELKRHKNKPDERFSCTLLAYGADHTVLWYRAPTPGAVRNILLPAGTSTIAHYWNDRAYVLWRMFYPCGAQAGTLLHICCEVCMTPEQISYLDLIVDIWIAPSGAVQVLDEDELEYCVATGIVSGCEQTWIMDQKQMLLATHAHIIAEAEQQEAYIDVLKGVLVQ